MIFGICMAILGILTILSGKGYPLYIKGTVFSTQAVIQEINSAPNSKKTDADLKIDLTLKYVVNNQEYTNKIGYKHIPCNTVGNLSLGQSIGILVSENNDNSLMIDVLSLYENGVVSKEHYDKWQKKVQSKMKILRNK